MDILTWIIIVHFIVVIIFFILRFINLMVCDYIIILIGFFVPVWGIIIILVKEFFDRKRNPKRRIIDVNHMEVEEVMKSVRVDDKDDDIVPISEALIVNDNELRRELLRDILYDVNSSIKIEVDEVFEKVVPLNEALVINDSATRRALIMDVLYTNPSDYVSQLVDAKKNDDTEVVHYAVTALVELQKEFDLKFQDIMKRKEQNPDDRLLDKEYEKLLERYIACGLLQGDGLVTQLRNYRDLLIERIDKGDRNWSMQCKLADTDLKLRDVDNLTKDVEEMIIRWPERDSTYIYRFKLAILTGNSDMMQEIFDELVHKDVYMSAELKGLLKFWHRENNEEKV